jgi:hypothetical protein
MKTFKVKMTTETPIIKQYVIGDSPIEEMEATPKCSQCHKQWSNNDTTEFPDDQVVLAWAEFLSPTIFNYGLSGTFQLTEGSVKSDEYPVAVCNSCLKAFQYEPYLNVTCGNCHEKYQGLFPSLSTDQGYKCSASVNEIGIRGEYGSCKYDDEVLKWTHGIIPDSMRHVKNICDKCITTLIEQKVVERNPYYM